MSNEQPQQALWDTDASKLTVNTRYAAKRYQSGYNTGHAEGYQSGYLEGVKVNSAQTAELKVRVAELEQERATLTARVESQGKAMDAYQQEIASLRIELAAAQARVAELEQLLEDTKSDIEYLHDEFMYREEGDE